MPYGRKFPYGRSLSPACSSISLSRSSTPCWCPPRGGFRRWRTPARNTIPTDGSTRARLVGPPPAGRAVPDSRRPGVSALDDSRSVRIPVPPPSRRPGDTGAAIPGGGVAPRRGTAASPRVRPGRQRLGGALRRPRPPRTSDRIRRNAAVASLHDRPRRCSRSLLPHRGSRACLSTACRRLRSPSVCRLPASSGSPSSRIVNFDNAGLLYFAMACWWWEHCGTPWDGGRPLPSIWNLPAPWPWFSGNSVFVPPESGAASTTAIVRDQYPRPRRARATGSDIRLPYRPDERDTARVRAGS